MSVNTLFSPLLNGSLSWAPPHERAFSNILFCSRQLCLKHLLLGAVNYNSFSWAFFAVHSLAKGPQPGQEEGAGSVVSSPFVDLEGNWDS